MSLGVVAVAAFVVVLVVMTAGIVVIIAVLGGGGESSRTIRIVNTYKSFTVIAVPIATSKCLICPKYLDTVALDLV